MLGVIRLVFVVVRVARLGSWGRDCGERVIYAPRLWRRRQQPPGEACMKLA